MSRSLSSSALVAVLLAAAGSVPAAAQTPRPERPYRGLFGSGVSETGQLLTVSGTIGAGYDDNLLADLPGGNTIGTVGGGVPPRGVLGSASGSLAYTLQRDRISFGASAGTNARYYPQTERHWVRGSAGQLSLAAQLRPSTSVSATATAAYQPYSFGILFPSVVERPFGEAPVPDLDTAVTPDSYLSYEGNLGLTHRLSRRTSVTGSYSYRTTSGELHRGFAYHSAGARLTHNIGRGLGLRAGYSYGQARYPDGRQRPIHTVDAGVNYSHSLSISRRTTLDFGTGTATTEREGDFNFTLTGNAQLTHEIGRTWHAFVGYGRRVIVHESWGEPVMSDALTGGLGGLITRRIQFTSIVHGAIGNIGAARSAPGFDSVHGSATLSVALSRFMSAGVVYSYYHHRFDERVALPLGALSSMDRQSVRASISVWAPLFQRLRSGDASR